MSYATGYIGAGICPAGTCAAGIGVPAPPATSPAPVVFANPNGDGPAQLTSRMLDPGTGQYVFVNGAIIGQTTMQQNTTLAWKTTLGTCVVSTVGNTLSSIDTIGDDLLSRVTTAMTSAVQSYINDGLMEILSVDVSIFATSGACVTVEWRDLTTGLDNTFSGTI